MRSSSSLRPRSTLPRAIVASTEMPSEIHRHPMVAFRHRVIAARAPCDSPSPRAPSFCDLHAARRFVGRKYATGSSRFVARALPHRGRALPSYEGALTW